MLGKLLAFLAWAGLYRVPLQVLNAGNAPPANLTITPTQAADITANFMESLVKDWVSEDGKKVSYLALEESSFYKTTFQEFRSLLKITDPSEMEDMERKTFFINLYNILTIDALLSMNSLPRSTISVTKFWSRYAYQVGRYQLTLDEIEHGILRGNRQHPTSANVMFESDDPRLRLAVHADHRIHSALNCGAASCPPLSWFETNRLERQLDSAMTEFCTKGVTNINGSALIINSIFQWFSNDFASTEQLTLKFLSECVDDLNMRRALEMAANGRRKYTFFYDWSLNSFSGSSGGRVKVEVYLQSLCSDTVRFFLRQLYPTWRDLQDIMDLEFIPYGKARATPTSSGEYTFECQHGPDECYGNLVMTCAQNSLPIATQVEFYHCMFSEPYPAFTGKKCSEEIGIDWTPLDQCAKSNVGGGLLYENGVRTASLKPRLHYIPTITVDGHYDNFQLRTSLMSLKNQICSVYQGPPHQNCL